MSNRTAWDFVKDEMKRLAMEDSKNAGGWEAIEDSANIKLQVNGPDYMMTAMIEYLKCCPHPLKAGGRSE